jgi:ABC-type lipoprotein export system ATPase subunit
MKKFRVPSKDEVINILNWGGYRLILTVPAIGLYTLRQLSRLALHVTSESERYYHQFVLQPFDALIWGESQNILEAEVIDTDTVNLFDFSKLKAEPDAFPHIRIIGKSGQGKTVLARYLLYLLGGNQYVITTKKKPRDWSGLPVYGAPFKYDECEEYLNKTLELMYSNYQLIEKGLTPEFTNIAVDEWRSQQKNIDSAKETMKELISQARDAKVRILAIATGEQVAIWGLEGESDLEECFTTIRLGEFALEYARRIKAPKSVLSWLNTQKRPCMVDRYPAEIPDLSSFRPSTEAVLLKPSLQPEKTAETITHTGLQRLQNDQNEVLTEPEVLLYKAFKAFSGSESDFIKQVWGANRYQFGKAELVALRAKFEG